MPYLINEGSLDLPTTGRIDRTLNVLAMPDGSGVTYLISRDRLLPGESLAQMVERQLHDLAGQVRGFEITLKPTPISLRAVSSASGGLEFGTAFAQQGQAIHQRQAALQMPETDNVLIITLSSFEPFDEPTLSAWAAVVGSFKPRSSI